MRIPRLGHILILLVWSMIVSTTQALVPPPDGGYPNFTTAEGSDVLKHLSTGAANTSVGWRSLFTNSTGNYNTGTGAATLVLNNGDENTAAGAAALLLNTSGNGNTATGAFALLFNDTGTANTAIGDQTLYSNTEGNFNTATGFFALHDNIGGVGNTAIGSSALQHNTTGGLNTAIGGNALSDNTEADENTAIGVNALSSNTIGIENTAIGTNALSSNTTGFRNTANGVNALHDATVGQDNTANGHLALGSSTDGTRNTAMGSSALLNNTEGSFNTAVGPLALAANIDGNSNTALGDSAGSEITGSGNVCIGRDVVGEPGVNNTTYIRNVYDSQATARILYVDANNKIGTLASSRRYKEDVRSMDEASEALFALNPVTFRYKKKFDPTATPQFGLIAEEVEKVNSDLIARDKDGKPYSVRYDAVNAMLLNEFLKEHRTVQAQQKEIDSLKQELKAQRAFIEKVNARMDKVAPQLVMGEL